MCASRISLMRLAMAEAGKNLRQFDVNFTEPIDIFRIIREAKIELFFRPLEGKADGYYVPPTNSRKAGVLLNSRRPLSRKRYTAAHELCHFLRNDTPRVRVEVMSEECGVTGKGVSDEESLADFFASHFLMPPKLVTNFYRKLGLKKEPLSPAEVYRLSLCMGTSYLATCHQLTNLEFISREHSEKLLKIKPQQIKTESGVQKLGHRDVWSVGFSMSGLMIIPQVDDVIRVTLPESPSTGYVWSHAISNRSVVEFESSTLRLLGSQEVVGQSGHREMVFRIQKPGNDTLNIELRRPWEKSGDAAENFNLSISACEREFNGDYTFQLLSAAA